MKKCNDTIYERFKDYNKEFSSTTSEILFPPEIYNEIKKFLSGKILDIGTGDGVKLENLIKICGYKKIEKVVAIDPSPLYKIAQERFKCYNNIEVLNIAIEDFYSAELFDTVTIFEVLEHSYAPEQIIQRIVGLIKPNGTVILSTPNRPIYDFTEKLIKGRLDPTHVNEMNKAEILKLVKKYFHEVKLMGILPMMKLGRKFPFFLKIHQYITLPQLYNTLICFARVPKKNLQI